MIKGHPDIELKQWLCSVIKEGQRTTLPELNEFDWNVVLRQIEHEGISALFAREIRAADIFDALPESFTANLRALEKNQAALQLRRHVENKSTLRLFQENQLPLVILKGEALANTLYPEPYLRTRCDTDLLVENRVATENVWELLKARGYVKKPTLEGKFVGFQFSCRKLLGIGIESTFDVHNQINDYIWLAKKLPFREVYSGAEEIDYDGLTVRCINPIHALLHACIHRITNKPLNIQDRLIWLYDIHMLCECFAEPEWRKFVHLVEEKELGRICLEAILVTQSYFKTDVPRQHLSEINALANEEPSRPIKLARRWEFYLYDFMQNKGVSNKTTQIVEHLFPPTSYMFEKYNLHSRVLLPYFYAKRILQGMLKYK